MVSVTDRLVEIKESVGAKANGSDYCMVERSILVRLYIHGGGGGGGGGGEVEVQSLRHSTYIISSANVV